jgi:pyruvate dehydrogenase E2 component (dihydrolipoamide acetyltransferase)
MSEILMPQLSSSMEQGTILTWLKVSGDAVQIGDEILEIETDKSTVTYAAEEAGVLTTLVEEGATVEVGVPIAEIGDTVAAPAATGVSETGEPAPAIASGEPAAPDSEPAAQTSAGAANGRPDALDAPASGSGPRATPLARRIAATNGIALHEVNGSGRLGRITRGDVIAHAGIRDGELEALPKLRDSAPAAGPAALSPVAIGSLMLPGSRVEQPTRLQQLIARRMATAKATIPHFQVQTEVVMDTAIELRAQFKTQAEEGENVPSLNDFIIKAAALALREHPLANASYHADGFVLHEQINVGLAVAAADALIVPTVFDTASKSIGQIAEETRALAGRARNGQIAPTELEGGTFTVSNLGMFGMTAINPVVNPPQAAILGVGSLRPTLARIDGQIVDRTLMSLTLSCDHRILYGADAARFLARIRELLEKPLKLVL